MPQSWFEGGEKGNGKDEDRETTNNATHKKTTQCHIVTNNTFFRAECGMRFKLSVVSRTAKNGSCLL